MLIRHLFEASDYEPMIKTLAPLGLKWMVHARRDLSRIRQVLHRNDQVVWWFRWYRYAAFMNAMVDAETPQDKDRIEAGFKRIEETFRKAGIDTKGEFQFFGTPHALSRLFNDLDHFLSLPIPAIQEFRFGWETWPSIRTRFVEAEAIWKNNRQGAVTIRSGDKVVVKVGPNAAWWLLDRGYCSDEANAMGHCGNAGSKSGDRILSFRQSIKKGSETLWMPSLTFILHADGFLGEMKGRGNDKPAERYHGAIVALLKNRLIKGIRGGGYLPANNFALSDLPPEMADDLYAERPDLMPLAARFRRDGSKVTPELLGELAGQLGTIVEMTLDPEKMYDPATQQMTLWTQRRKSFIDDHVTFDKRRYTKAHVGWVNDVLSGEEHLEYYDVTPSTDEMADILTKMQEKHPEKYAKIARYIIAEEALANGDDDDTEAEAESELPSPKELAEMADEHDLFEDAFKRAVSTGRQYGAENEMSEALDEWKKSPPIDDESSVIKAITLVDDSTNDKWQVRVSVENAFQLLDDHSKADGEDAVYLLRVKDMKQPDYGWDGYDEDGATQSFVEDDDVREITD